MHRDTLAAVLILDKESAEAQVDCAWKPISKTRPANPERHTERMRAKFKTARGDRYFTWILKSFLSVDGKFAPGQRYLGTVCSDQLIVVTDSSGL
jgi:hypothetical protein